MNVSSILWRERQDAYAQMRPLLHIRVTSDAIPGAPVTVAVTPERARVLGKLWAFPDGSVDASRDTDALETLIHPEDWADLLKELPTGGSSPVQLPLSPGEPFRVFGIPVTP